jgi:hypothetical protein
VKKDILEIVEKIKKGSAHEKNHDWHTAEVV